jgi:hypothetical protein
MTNDDYLKRIREYAEELRKDPERLKVFLRKIMGRPYKTLEGNEREQVLTMLALTEPYEQTNNQQSWTDCYNVGGIEYHLTYFPEDKNAPIVDKMLKEEE